jgi:hypothetical protein
MHASYSGVADPLQNKVGILTRLLLTFALLLIAVVMTALSGAKPIELISNVACGLFVLGAAGIWVTYFAERQAIASLRQRIDACFSILQTSNKAGIEDSFYDPSNVRDVGPYKEELLKELESAKGEIRILAVAGREFFHEGQGFASAALKRAIEAASARRGDPNLALKVLLLHPLSEPAVTRGLREKGYQDVAFFEDTDLWTDVGRSCVTICAWKRDGYPIEARLYKVMPCCFLIFINDVLYAEFYHLGAGGRASGKVILSPSGGETSESG